MNKILYSDKDLFTVVGNNTLILSTVSLQPLKDPSYEVEKVKALYTPAYRDYVITTEDYRKKKILNNLLGRSYWFGYQDLKQRIAFIYVSKKNGKWHCPLISITKRTVLGLDQLLTNLPPTIEVHCGKLNTNYTCLWPDTEKAINNLLQKFPKHRIIVHD